MKTLIFSGETYQADRIVKTDTDIIGYIANQEVFAFRGISNWSLFQLADGQEWDIDEKGLEAAYLLDLDFRISMLELGVV